MSAPKPKVALPPRVLRLPAVLEFVGLSESQLEQKIALGEFPEAIKLFESGRSKAWLTEEVTAWLDSRVAARDKRKREQAA